MDGAPYFMDQEVYTRADTVVAPDYRKSLVLRRALWRTLRVELGGHPDGAHERVGLRGLLRNADHPLRWAWSSHSERSREAREVTLRPELASATVVRFTTPSSAEAWLSGLS